MKKTATLVLALGFFSGCADTSTLIKANSSSSRTGIYDELAESRGVPTGYATLRVSTTIKTHKPGIGPASDIHGTKNYRLLLNIDGQALFLAGNPSEENRELGKLQDPEAGSGIRYRFDGNFRVQPGRHRIVLALPEDDVAVERDIALEEGSANTLVLVPIYSEPAGKRRLVSLSSFLQGVSSFWVRLNGRNI